MIDLHAETMKLWRAKEAGNITQEEYQAGIDKLIAMGLDRTKIPQIVSGAEKIFNESKEPKSEKGCPVD